MNGMENGFKDITITNFRGFDYLEIKSLQKLNIFVGANNVGKTSILEAAFMLTGMSNPFISSRVNYLRTAISFDNIDSARYLFHNIDFSKKPLLKGAMANGEIRKMTFSPVTFLNETDASSSNSNGQSTIRQLNFDLHTTQKYTSKVMETHYRKQTTPMKKNLMHYSSLSTKTTRMQPVSFQLW